MYKVCQNFKCKQNTKIGIVCEFQMKETGQVLFLSLSFVF